jgi:hypothetical protein
MSVLRGLATVANSVGSGLMQGQEIKRQREIATEDRAFQMEQRGRIRQQYGDEDATRDALRKADEAGRTAYLSALDGQPAQPEQRQGAVDNYLTNGGSDGSMPDQSKLDNFDPAAAPVVKPAQPEKPGVGQDQALLAGMTARARTLAENAKAAPGVSNEWLKTHNDAMTLRGQMRLTALDQAEARWRATGDPSHMKDVYNLLDDGFTAKDIARTPDGKIRMASVNNKTGEEVVSDATEEQFQKVINFLRDPKATRQLEAKQALQDDLQQWMLKRIADQGLANAKVQDVKNAGQEKVQGLKNGGKLDQIDAKGEIDERIARLRADAGLKQAGIRVQGSMTLAQFKASRAGGGGSGSKYSLRELADGTILAINQRDPSDTQVLTDDNGNARVSAKAVDQAMKAADQVSKGLGAMQNTPEQNAAAGAAVVKGLANNVRPPPIAPRASGGSAPAPVAGPRPAPAKTVGGKPVQSFWGD